MGAETEQRKALTEGAFLAMIDRTAEPHLGKKLSPFLKDRLSTAKQLVTVKVKGSHDDYAVELRCRPARASSHERPDRMPLTVWLLIPLVAGMSYGHLTVEWKDDSPEQLSGSIIVGGHEEEWDEYALLFNGARWPTTVADALQYAQYKLT